MHKFRIPNARGIEFGVVVHNNITKYLEWEVLTFVMARMATGFTWQNVTSSLEIGINAPWDKALFA